MDREQIDALVKQYVSARFQEIEERLSYSLPQSNDAGREVYRDELYEELEKIEYRLKEGDYRDTLPIAESMLKGAAPYAVSVLARRLLEAKHETLCAEIEGSQGRPWRKLIEVQTSHSAPAKEPPKETPLLSVEIADYCGSKTGSKKKWTAKTAGLNKGRLRTCLELMGDQQIREYEPQDIEKLQAILSKVPTNFRSWAEFKKNNSLTAHDAIAMADQSAEQVERLSPSSVNEHTRILRSVFLASVRKRLIERSPTDGLEEVEEDSRPRKPFSDGDLRLIFTDLKDAAKGRPSYWWVPRILLYTGARLEEVCQLCKEDVQQHHGIRMLDINREGSKKLKTDHSERYVPIHSELVKMGFLEFVESIPSGHLFTDLPFKKNGYGDSLSKWAGRRLRAVGITDPQKVANHSFRHTMATRLGSAGVEGQMIDKLQGWKINTGSERGRYVHEFEAQAMKAAIEKFTIPKGVLQA